MISEERNNVTISGFILKNKPATLVYEVEALGAKYYSEIIYESIDDWEEVKKNLPQKDSFNQIISTIIVWDAMRFMALGGEELILCDSMSVTEEVIKNWKYCFLNQFGEWRYKNNFTYTSEIYPKLTPTNIVKKKPERLYAREDGKEERWLIANGGGKDSLAGMILLNAAGVDFDIYEGYLPMGADWSTQKKLLQDVRESVCSAEKQVISIKIRDNFYSKNDDVFTREGIKTQHFKTDFAVGHTANYAGYFPVIIAHNFNHVWFNIEASADRVMKVWNGEEINHQWCKSTAYQKISKKLFESLTGIKFGGFRSTIRGLHDTQIYAIVSNDKASLFKTHSCNIQKPWCGKCAKCCFSYLMMSSVISEEFAMATMKLDNSLFDNEEVRKEWGSLLDKSQVAWECVPSHQECVLALKNCLEKGYASSLESYKSADDINSKYKFSKIDWSKIPREIRQATSEKILVSGNFIYNDIVIIGAGQAGLSMSFLLKDKGINHVILEAETIGNSWKNRWDSFQLNTPNLTISFPGRKWERDNGQGFMTHIETKKYLEDYAIDFDLPVLESIKVLKVRKEDGNFKIETNKGLIICKQLVVASGEYAEEKHPQLSDEIKNTVHIIHSKNYKNTTEISGKNVLVIGGGQSGAQIVEELSENGFKVYWSLSSRPSNIRRLRGKDFMEWWDIGGVIHKHIDEYPVEILNNKAELKRLKDMEFPLVSGLRNGGKGKSVSLKKIADQGVVFLDKYTGSINTTLTFGDNIKNSIDKAVNGTREQFELLNKIADEYYKDKQENYFDDREFIPEEITCDWEYDLNIQQLDITSIDTIICATGYKKSWDWIEIDGVFDDDGLPLGKHSVSDIHGLFFLGLFNTPRLSTTCLCNGGRDANDILEILINKDNHLK